VLYGAEYSAENFQNSSSQDFWANQARILPNFGEKLQNITKFGKIWLNSSSQKILGLLSNAYPTVACTNNFFKIRFG